LVENNQSMNSDVINVLKDFFWPVAAAIISFFLVRLIRTLDRVDKSVSQLDKTVVRQETEQKDFKESYREAQANTVKRLDAHADLLDTHDRKITTLEERVKHG
jgi:hypothetical protein